MRRIALLLPLVVLAACSSPEVGVPAVPAPAARAFAGPEVMAGLVTEVVPLTECNAPTRDAYGVMYVSCVDPTGGIVRFSVFDEGRGDGGVLTENGWVWSGGSTWSVAVNSDKATLNRVMSALR